MTRNPQSKLRSIPFVVAGGVLVAAIVFAVFPNDRFQPGGRSFFDEEQRADPEAEKAAWERAIADLEKAETLAVYLQSLEQIAESRFGEDDMVRSAREVIAQKDVLELWRQALLMPDDPRGWEAIHDTMTLIPPSPLPQESEKFRRLLEESSYPAGFFQLHEREGELLQEWRAAGVIDRDEGIISVPLLRLVDDLRGHAGINDLFRAYVHQQLGSVMAFREHQWGLHFAPAFVHDLAALGQLAGQISSEQTMHAMDHVDSLILPIFRFYTERSSVSCYRQALAFQDLFKRGVESEMAFIGSVDAEGNVHLTEQPPDGRILWALHKDGGLSRIRADSPEDRQPLSPVLYFSYGGKGERGLLEAVFDETGVDLTAQEHRHYLPPLGRAGTLPGAERYAFSSPLQRILAGASAPDDDALREEEAHRKIDDALDAERTRLLRWAEEQEQQMSRIERQKRWRFFTDVQGALRNFDVLQNLLLGRRSEEVRYALGNPSRADFNIWEYDNVLRYGASRRVLEIEFSGNQVTRVTRGRAINGE